MKVQLSSTALRMEVEAILHDDHKAAEWLRSFERTLGCEGLNREPNPFALSLIIEAEGFKANLSYLKMRNAVMKELGDGATPEEIEAKLTQKYGKKYQNIFEAMRRRDELQRRLVSADVPAREDGNEHTRTNSVSLESGTSADTPAKSDAKKKKPHGQFNNVMLTDDEFFKWESHHNANALLEELSSYLASSGKRYKSHYATLLNWERRRESEAKEDAPKGFYSQSQAMLEGAMQLMGGANG